MSALNQCLAVRWIWSDFEISQEIENAREPLCTVHMGGVQLVIA